MDYDGLTRKELQSLCKKHGIRANMTNVAMADALKSFNLFAGLETGIPSTYALILEDSTMNSPTSGSVSCRRTSLRSYTRSMARTTRSRQEAEKQEEPKMAVGGVSTGGKIDQKESKQEETKGGNQIQGKLISTPRSSNIYYTRRSEKLRLNDEDPENKPSAKEILEKKFLDESGSELLDVAGELSSSSGSRDSKEKNLSQKPSGGISSEPSIAIGGSPHSGTNTDGSLLSGEITKQISTIDENAIRLDCLSEAPQVMTRSIEVSSVDEKFITSLQQKTSPGEAGSKVIAVNDCTTSVEPNYIGYQENNLARNEDTGSPNSDANAELCNTETSLPLEAIEEIHASQDAPCGVEHQIVNTALAIFSTEASNEVQVVGEPLQIPEKLEKQPSLQSQAQEPRTGNGMIIPEVNKDFPDFAVPESQEKAHGPFASTEDSASTPGIIEFIQMPGIAIEECILNAGYYSQIKDQCTHGKVLPSEVSDKVPQIEESDCKNPPLFRERRAMPSSLSATKAMMSPESLVDKGNKSKNKKENIEDELTNLSLRKLRIMVKAKEASNNHVQVINQAPRAEALEDKDNRSTNQEDNAVDQLMNLSLRKLRMMVKERIKQK